MKYYSVELGYIAYGVMTFHRTQRSLISGLVSSFKNYKHNRVLDYAHKQLPSGEKCLWLLGKTNNFIEKWMKWAETTENGVQRF